MIINNIITQTLEKGVYVAKSDAECSAEELQTRLESSRRLDTRAAEIAKESARDKAIAQTAIYDHRSKYVPK